MLSSEIERFFLDHATALPGDVEASSPPSPHAHGWVPASRRDQQRVISRRGRVEASRVPSFIREALEEIRDTIERHHVEVQGPPFYIRQPSRLHEVDVEVAWPVKGASAAGRVSTCELPISLARRGSEYGDAAS